MAMETAPGRKRAAQEMPTASSPPTALTPQSVNTEVLEDADSFQMVDLVKAISREFKAETATKVCEGKPVLTSTMEWDYTENDLRWRRMVLRWKWDQNWAADRKMLNLMKLPHQRINRIKEAARAALTLEGMAVKRSIKNPLLPKSISTMKKATLEEHLKEFGMDPRGLSRDKMLEHLYSIPPTMVPPAAGTKLRPPSLMRIPEPSPMPTENEIQTSVEARMMAQMVTAMRTERKSLTVSLEGEKLMNYTMTIGRHKGLKLSAVVRDQPGYANWAVNEVANKGEASHMEIRLLAKLTRAVYTAMEQRAAA